MHEAITLIAGKMSNAGELAKAQAQMQRFDRNLAWLQSHASEAFSHRGKVICVAGQELFVGDTVTEALAKAKAVHPEDDGQFTKYIPSERGPRIYAH